MASLVEPLTPKHLKPLKALLAREPSHNLYLLGLLEEFGIVPGAGREGFTFWGRFLADELTAVLFVGGLGGLMVPSSSLPGSIAEIAKVLNGKVKLGSAIGEKGAIDVLVQHLCPTGRPKLSRLQQLYSVSADDLGPFTNPLLRLGTEADVEKLVPMAADAIKEIMKRDPMAEDPLGFPARVLQRVRSKRTYVFEEKGRLVFKIDVGSRSQFGAELEGLYTVPDERRRGHATLSLGQIARHLLSSLPRLTLRVDEKDPALAGVARKVGFLAGRTQRLVVID